MSIKSLGGGASGDITALTAQVNQNTAAIATKVDESTRDQALGFAGLDASGKIPPALIDLTGGSFKDLWNASTNTPTITSGQGTNGDYYIVSVAGTTLIDGISEWAVGDTIVFSQDAGVWRKSEGTKSKAEVLADVEKVNAATGYTLAGGTTTTKTLTVSEDATINQDVSNTASPQFAEQTLTNLQANKILASDVGKRVVSTGISHTEGANNFAFNKGTTTFSVTTSSTVNQDLSLTADVTHNSYKSTSEAANAGKLAKIGTDGLFTSSGYSTDQDILTTSSPSFNQMTLSGMSAYNGQLMSFGAGGFVNTSGIGFTFGLNTFSLSNGTSGINVTASCDLDQNISSTSDVTHNSQKLTSEVPNVGKLLKIGTDGLITSSGYQTNQDTLTTSDSTLNSLKLTSESANNGQLAAISLDGAITGSGYHTNQNLRTTDSATFLNVYLGTYTATSILAADVNGKLVATGYYIDQNVRTTDDVSFRTVAGSPSSGSVAAVTGKAGGGSHNAPAGYFWADPIRANLTTSVVLIDGNGYRPSSGEASFRVTDGNARFDDQATSGAGRVTSEIAGDAVLLSDSTGYLKSITLQNLLDKRTYSYTSGWISVGINNQYVVTHNLGTTDIVVWLQFTPALNSSSIFTGVQGSLSADSSTGLFVEIYDTNTLYIDTGNNYVLSIDNTHRYGDTQPSNHWTSGYARVIIQKYN